MKSLLRHHTKLNLLAAASLLLVACGQATEQTTTQTTIQSTIQSTSQAPVASAQNTAADSTQSSPIEQFMAAIAQHCGQAFEGRITANEPPVDNDPFVGQALVMHVRECSDNELRIPFHVGDNHSRTWILTRTDTGLRLKHDHRHEDGSDDDVTMYGGDTTTPGTAVRQEFPVDQFSIDMFLRDGNTASGTNTCAMEIEPGSRFLYELSRPSGRLFQVEFDLTTPVPAPPTPWGHPELP
jgi:hypothetical protein